VAALERGSRLTDPYLHWLVADTLPAEAAEGIHDLPIGMPSGLVFNGRRETNNASRTYFNAETHRRFPVARAFAEAFQAQATVAAIERVCGADLDGTNLRVEYCQDSEGFWLEPHSDIGVKRFTMSLFLCRGPGADSLGTDIYAKGPKWVGRAPSAFNSAMIFIPAGDTLHGFVARPIHGVRKSLIVNYVTSEWRNRHELAYPETPVRSAD
jgi:hypothetical protein